jgi:hypothetical protein
VSNAMSNRKASMKTGHQIEKKPLSSNPAVTTRLTK